MMRFGAAFRPRNEMGSADQAQSYRLPGSSIDKYWHFAHKVPLISVGYVVYTLRGASSNAFSLSGTPYMENLRVY